MLQLFLYVANLERLYTSVLPKKTADGRQSLVWGYLQNRFRLLNTIVILKQERKVTIKIVFRTHHGICNQVKMFSLQG